MPRKKSIVHQHFKTAVNQGDRKVELVECIHCGHNIAGNNVARLLKHLQHGCWPAASPEDPALLMDSSPISSPPVARNGEIRSGNADIEQFGSDNIVPRSTPTRPPNSRPPRSTPRRTGTADRPKQSTDVQSFLIQVIIKETKDPAVSRLFAVPKSFTFRHLQRTFSAAFGYTTVNGMFEITYPNWLPGRGRPPRRNQICIFHDEEQKNSWHAWDEPTETNSPSDERYLDNVALDDLLSEVKSSNICFHVGPWAHEVEVLGELSQRLPSTRHAICLAGEGHPVLESSDPLMWQAFKDAYAANPPNATQKSYRLFYEKECLGGDSRGLGGAMPWKWDKAHVNRELRNLPAAPEIPSAAPINTAPIAQQHVDDEQEDDDHPMTGDTTNEINNTSQNVFDQQNRALNHQAHQSSPYSLEQIRYA